MERKKQKEHKKRLSKELRGLINEEHHLFNEWNKVLISRSLPVTKNWEYLEGIFKVFRK